MRTESQARIIVVIEWVFFAFLLLLVTIFGVAYRQLIKEISNGETPDVDRQSLFYLKAVSVILFVYLCFYLFLNVLLTKGVHQERSNACKAWYIINMVFMGFYVLDLAVALITMNVIGLIIQGPFFAYKIYAIKTIMTLTDQLNRPTINNLGGVVYISPTVAVGPTYPDLNPPPYYFEKGHGPGEAGQGGQVTVNVC